MNKKIIAFIGLFAARQIGGNISSYIANRSRGERLGETNVWKTQGGAVPSIADIYSLIAIDCPDTFEGGEGGGIGFYKSCMRVRVKQKATSTNIFRSLIF